MTKLSSQFNNETVQLLAGHTTISQSAGHSRAAELEEPRRVELGKPENLNGPLFAQVPFDILTFSEGETLFKEDEVPKGIYILKSGCIKVYIQRKSARGRTTSAEYVTRLVAPDEIFGYAEIISGNNLQCFAQAVKTSTVWFYSVTAIGQMLSQVNPILQIVMKQAVSDLQNYEMMSQFHYLASVQERIAFQLLNLADRFGVKVSKGISIHLKLTRNEFAQLAGTINESLSRHLTEFKNEGLIDINGKEIIILNREALAAKSGNIAISI
jgi:CRP-like cAMP-binding protein